ncbi:MAG TPA: saccharopine dehydrogenase NADP-binding domain-containing protein, partial [Ilumatobacteraceae bacterium]
MRVLIVGAGGVGSALATICARREVFEQIIVADVDPARSARAAATANSELVVSTRVDASHQQDVVELAAATDVDVIVNACDPRFNPPIFNAAFEADCDYIDMAMHLSVPHPTDPYNQIGVSLGAAQFDANDAWAERGLLALVGMGVEPGFSDVVARYAADHLFSTIDEIGVRDGSDLVIEGFAFAPTFSIWTTIEECLNPPIVYERDRGWFTTAPFSEPELFTFPDDIGQLRCVNVEHEEVLLMPRWVDCKRATFKYGLGNEFIDVLKVLHKIGLDKTDKVKVGGVEVSPRDVVAACLPDPATLGDKMTGKTCAGLYVTGKDKDGQPRATYLYHVVDNEWAMQEYGHQCVV